MKIDQTSEIATASLVKDVNATAKKRSDSDSVRSTTAGRANHAAAHNADRIRHWFSRIGVADNMTLHDAARRRNIIERRREMLALQRIKNLQNIMEEALGTALTDISSENLDPDWFFAFSHMAENIYSKTMQTLWGKILAVEISCPGSFSLRSLETLKILTQRDADVFSKVVSISATRPGDTVPRILIGYHQKPGLFSLLGHRQPDPVNLAEFGVGYPDLLALSDMKLIYNSEIESGELPSEQASRWRVGTSSFMLKPARTGLALVYIKFTAVGAELAKLISKKDNASYLAALKQKLNGPFAVVDGH
ncbi:TIGR03899 family protein [Aestuariibacter sp. A3R04]|uniref:TIGR03899 family protein n=1 Tax=Aestuariibacter sp. A3R04 TaxID=2841571 RepID=UPI001C094AC4|nr:TIGR03899 family protein [Aestuariibacter sp. A3R04]MBU3022003.1 TIGR03899 family protein [Aestuariibacter sp. A3R04]